MRRRRATLASISAVGARLVSVAVSLITIPLTLAYLGTERFGLWVTISSFQLLLVFADLGLGSGLINVITEADGGEDRVRTQRAVSSAFYLLVGLSMLLGAIAWLVVPSTDWASLFNVKTPEAAAEVGPAMAAFAACFVVGLPLGIVYRVQVGSQEGFANGLWLAAGSIVSLIGLILAVRLNAGLPWLVLALFGGPLLATCLDAVVVFGWQKAWARPRLDMVELATVRRLIRIGSSFFILQLVISVAYQTDTIVAASVVGPDAAAEYAISYRLLMFAPALIGIALMTLWPAYGEAFARGDIDWIKGSVRSSATVALVAASAATILILAFHKPILDAWVGPTIAPSWPLLLGMAAWAIVSTAFNAVAVLFNGLGILRFQVGIGMAMAVASVLSSIALAHQFGVAGVIWGTVLAYVVCSALPTAIYLPRLLRSLPDRARAADQLRSDP